MCFPTTFSRQLAKDEYLPKEASEVLASKHVDDKVGRGVDCQEQMGNRDQNLNCGCGIASRVFGMLANDGLVDVRDDLETLASDEHDDDANQDNGHVAFFGTKILLFSLILI